MELNEYVSVASTDYEVLFDKIEHTKTINGVKVNLRFKYIKFTPNGELKLDLLVDTLVSYFTHFCFSAQKRQLNDELTDMQREQQRNKLQTEARKLFRKWNKEGSTSGEMGEMILWLLMEVVLKAPQIVAKMDLKTNPKLESFGSDGIHMKVVDDILNIYFGEAKLYNSVTKALDSIFESIEGFHENDMQQHEYNMVTTHYKYLKDNDKEKVFKFIQGNLETHELKVNHACLVGYDWKEYEKFNSLQRDEFLDDFIELYKNDTDRLTRLIQTRFDKFSKKNLTFEVFFLPVKSVQELRDKFNEEL